MEVSKVCSKCKLEKRLTEFYKDKYSKSGYYSSCKTCKNIKAKELRQKYSRLEIREEKDKKVCSRCKKEKTIQEYVKHRSCKDGFDGECKECKYKYNHAYSEARKLYDPKFKLLKSMRSRLGEALRGKSKSQTTRRLIGVNFEIFIKWVKFQFEEGMTLDNYGSMWHHDH